MPAHRWDLLLTHATLATLDGTVRVDPASAPEAVFQILTEQGTTVIPAALPASRQGVPLRFFKRD